MVLALHGPDLEALQVLDARHRLLGHEMADADVVDAEEPDAALGDDVVDLLEHRTAQDRDHVVLIAEQEGHVEELELRHEVRERGVRGRGDVEAAREHLLDHLDLAAELHVREDLELRLAAGRLVEVLGDHLEPEIHGLPIVLRVPGLEHDVSGGDGGRRQAARETERGHYDRCQQFAHGNHSFRLLSGG